MNTGVEHTSLRQEILENGAHAINVANIVVTLTGVAIVAAFQFRNPYVVLLPLFVLYYGYIVLFNNSQTIANTFAKNWRKTEMSPTVRSNLDGFSRL